MAIINLRQLPEWKHAVIANIAAQGELGQRIRDMGLIPGVELTVLGKAPLHDPVALRIGGSTIALRNSEADYINVEVK